MHHDSDCPDGAAHRATSAAAQRRWQKLCDEYLPVVAESSIWRYSRATAREDPKQGWKLHLSATILTANRVLAKVAPLLRSREVLFKVPSSLSELARINSGLYYGYSQVGKFLTVYPRSCEEAVEVARQLHRVTRGTPGPAVPFDLRWWPGSSVYYRYGSFEPLEMEGPSGVRVPAMRDPEGNLVPDSRDAVAAAPFWADDPFVVRRRAAGSGTHASPLRTTYRAFRALTQRGKGGVYKALDLSVSPPRLCVVKEGRCDGETGWDGRDGRWRVGHEGRVLASLRAAGVAAPAVYCCFDVEGNRYLVTEFIEGETLEALLARRRRRLGVARAVAYAAQLAALLERIHAAGWAWRDCKPSNLMLAEGVLRPLDFEGACPVDRPDPEPWGTPAFTPPAWGEGGWAASRKTDDIYALGAVLYLLLTGQLPAAGSLLRVKKLRRNAPAELCEMVAETMNPDPRRRPEAHAILQRLNAALRPADRGAAV